MLKIRSFFFTAAASAVFTVAAVAAAKYKIAGPSIAFNASGPGGLAINGKSSSLKISEDDKNITFTTFMNTLDTGIGMRNDHMQEKFEAKKFATVVLVVPQSSVDAKDKGDTKFSGKLTLHGVTNSVDGIYKVKGGHVTAILPDVDVSKYGIKPKEDLCRFGACASPNVKVTVQFDISQ